MSKLIEVKIEFSIPVKEVNNGKKKLQEQIYNSLLKELNKVNQYSTLKEVNHNHCLSKCPLHNLQTNLEKLHKFLEDCKHYDIELLPSKELFLYKQFLSGFDDQNLNSHNEKELNHKHQQSSEKPKAWYDRTKLFKFTADIGKKSLQSQWSKDNLA